MKINEKLGVPDFIYNCAKHIYYVMLSDIEEGNLIRVKSLRDTLISFKIEILFDEAEIPYKTIDLTLNINAFSKKDDEPNDVIITGGGYLNSSNINYVELLLDFIIEENVLLNTETEEDLYPLLQKCIEDNESEVIKTLSHELKHAYDYHKNSKLDKHIDNDFNAVVQGLYLSEPNISQFNYALYYSLCFENLTRPTEIFGELQSKNITKKNFAENFQKSKMYKELKWMHNFDKDKFLASIDMNNKDVKEIIAANNGKNTPEGFMEIYIGVMLNAIVKGKLYQKHRDNIVFLSLFDSSKIEKEANIIKSKFKMLHNVNNFLDFMEKRFKFVADTTIKRVYKIWDLFDSDEKENELMAKINKKGEKKNESKVLNKEALKYIKKFDINNWTNPTYKNPDIK